jgi:hypothetical protein
VRVGLAPSPVYPPFWDFLFLENTVYAVSLRMEVIRYAYSTFPDLLTKMRLTVADVHKRLIKRGFRFDKKTLYRLASPAPLHRIDAPVMGAICAEFKVSLDDLLVWEPVKPKLHRIDAGMQERLDALLEKNNEGTITAAEKKELEELGETVEHLSLENARMLARHSKQQRMGGRTFRAAAKRKAAKQ